MGWKLVLRLKFLWKDFAQFLLARDVANHMQQNIDQNFMLRNFFLRLKILMMTKNSLEAYWQQMNSYPLESTPFKELDVQIN